jgi:alpha(1,3/1,4) fucosyltransferase
LARGIPVHTADYLPREHDDVLKIYVSLGMRGNYRRLARRPDTILSAFFAMECPIVEPPLYRALPSVQRYFKRVLSWSDADALQRFMGRRLRCESFRWPQSYDGIIEPLWNRADRKFLVMINSNKRPRLQWQELYTERLRAVEFFARTGEIDLYGRGWDEPTWQQGITWVPYTLIRAQRALLPNWPRLRPDPLLVAARRTYQGPVRYKNETLSAYTFAICFENMILKGWITEKLFDCLFAGTVPVYLGAPDITEHVPADCFIDMRRFASYPELRNFLRSLEPRQVQAYRDNGREFLRSSRFQPFTRAAFAGIFARIMEEDAGGRQ